LESGNHDLEEIYIRCKIQLKGLMKDLLLEDQFYTVNKEYSIY